MDDGLLGEVMDLLDAAGLDPDIESVVLAACTDELAQLLDSGGYTRPEPAPAETRDPVGAYLSQGRGSSPGCRP